MPSTTTEAIPSVEENATSQFVARTANPPGQPYTTLYAVTIFLSAFLLFQVQLIIAKYVLPWFGGSPSVWNTCLLLFQLLLLSGYFYAHVVSTRFSPRPQTRL